MDRTIYKEHLMQAKRQLDDLLRQRALLDQRIALLRRDIGNLASLSDADDSQSVHKLLGDLKQQLGLKGSCLEVLRASISPLTAKEVVQGIERLGLDPGNHANLSASVSTTLRRMAENEEVEEGFRSGRKAYRLRAYFP